MGASVALPLAPTTEQAGTPTASRAVAIAAPPQLAFAAGAALADTDLTLAAGPIAALSGTPGVAATVAVVAGPEIAAGGAPEMSADAAIETAWLAAATGRPGIAASALITSTPGVMLSEGAASPITFTDGTIWDDGTPWIDD